MAIQDGLYFPGGNDARAVLSATIFPVGASTYSAVTIEALIKNEAAVQNYKFCVLTGLGGIGMYQGNAADMKASGYIGKSSISPSVPDAIFDVSAKTPLVWNRLSAVIAKGATYTTIKLYWNGVLLGQNASNVNNSAWYSNTPNGAVAGQVSAGLGSNFRGWIDDVRIWSRALSQSEITTNAAKELVGNESGLLHYWNFNEGFGTTSADAVATSPLTAYISGTGWSWTVPYVPPFYTYVIAAV